MKAFLFKHLVSRKMIGQVLKYVAAAGATISLTWLASAPGWVQGVIAYLADSANIELNEASLTILMTMLLAGAMQFALDRSNAKGTEKVQEALDVERDSWAGSQTIDAAQNLNAKVEAGRREISELRAYIQETKPRFPDV